MAASAGISAAIAMSPPITQRSPRSTRQRLRVGDDIAIEVRLAKRRRRNLHDPRAIERGHRRLRQFEPLHRLVDGLLQCLVTAATEASG